MVISNASEQKAECDTVRSIVAFVTLFVCLYVSCSPMNVQQLSHSFSASFKSRGWIATSLCSWAWSVRSCDVRKARTPALAVTSYVSDGCISMHTMGAFFKSIAKFPCVRSRSLAFSANLSLRARVA